MITGIMQPYLFPYIGYFQLINAVDKFVIMDDVQYIKHGWINRNKILIDGKEFLFTMSLTRDTMEKNINQRVFVPDIAQVKTSFLNQIKYHYAKAPYYQKVYNLIGEALCIECADIGKNITRSIREICDYLQIQTEFCISSELPRNRDLRREEMVIEICKLMKTTQYINAIGGMALYSKDRFADEGIQLHFIKTKPITYPQFKHPFVPSLSIIDVMMFNGRDEIQGMLAEYELI